MNSAEPASVKNKVGAAGFGILLEWCDFVVCAFLLRVGPRLERLGYRFFAITAAISCWPLPAVNRYSKLTPYRRPKVTPLC